MKNLILFLGFLAVMAIAQPALASAECKTCEFHFLWPWLEDCAFCDDANCGYILCTIVQNGDACSTDGENCGEGNPGCPTLQKSSLPLNEVTKTAESCATPLSARWRLARVRVQKRT